MEFLTRALVAGFAVSVCLGASTAAHSQTAPPQNSSAEPAISRVVKDLCNKRVVLLGEPPVHGFGKVLDFKVELTRRLVSECHFNGFFIESGIYDFLNIENAQHSGMKITGKMIEAAIGGIWANQEVERMIPDLLHGVESAKLKLGGLDDQLGRGTYAQHEMPGELAQYLHGDTKDECLSALQRHTLWQYSSDSPYSPKDKVRLIGCLDQIAAAASQARTNRSGGDLQMAITLKRFLSRDFPESPANGISQDIQSSNDRDRSMYQTFQWLQSRMPAHSRVIVWTASTHAAKDVSAVPGNEQRVSLGSLIHRDFGRTAFALGFSEYSGSYAFGSRPAKGLTIAPENALEARAFAKGDSETRYFDAEKLRKLGRISARPLGIDFKPATWDEVFDGIVVFHDEHPPTVSPR